jgi:hypothetical protein
VFLRVFLGSAYSINITSSCVARPITLRTALAAMTQVPCLLSLSCTLCQQYPAILSHLVSVHDNFFSFFSVCFLGYLLIEKSTLHSMHSKFLSPGCVCICSFKWPFCEQHSLRSLQLNGFSILSDTLHTDSTPKVLKASHQLSRLSRHCLTHSAIFAPNTGLHHI